jgi:hypothetical protein
MGVEPSAVDDPGSRTGAEGTDGAVETFDCPYCDRRFARETYRDLHLGQEHGERLDADERAAYEAAHDAEAEEIRLFRLKALAVLVLVYFGFLVVYAFAL